MNKRGMIRLCCLLMAVCLFLPRAGAEAPSFEQAFRQAEDSLRAGRVGEAEEAWTALQAALRSALRTDAETALLADTEFALGRTARLKGDFASAYDWYNSAFVWYKSLYGEQDARTLDARLHLILLMGEYLEMEEQALREARSVLLLDPPPLYRDLARIFAFDLYLRMNSLPGTEALLPDVRALADADTPEDPGDERAAVLGYFRPGDPRRLACQVLGDYYTDLNRPEEALAFYQLALQLTGGDSCAREEDRIESLLRVGFVYLYFSGDAAGVPWIDRALALAESAWPEGAELAYVCALAGEMYRRAGDWDRFGAYLARALALAESAAGENSALTADICLLYVPWHRMMGDYSRALSLCERSLRIQLSLLKDDTAILASTYNRLAHCRTDTGDYTGAVEALEKAVVLYRALGSGLQEAVAQRNLALILNNQLARHDEALACLRAALALAGEQPQDLYPETLAAVYMLTAEILLPGDPEYGQIGEYTEKAGLCLQNAAAGAEESLANYHYLTARYLTGSGQYPEARDHLLAALTLFETLYGSEEAFPVNLYYEIADCLRLMKDGAAAEWYRKAVTYAENRMALLQSQGIGSLDYLLSTRDNARHYLREWEKNGGSW